MHFNQCLSVIFRPLFGTLVNKHQLRERILFQFWTKHNGVSTSWPIFNEFKKSFQFMGFFSLPHPYPTGERRFSTVALFMLHRFLFNVHHFYFTQICLKIKILSYSTNGIKIRWKVHSRKKKRLTSECFRRNVSQANLHERKMVKTKRLIKNSFLFDEIEQRFHIDNSLLLDDCVLM